MSKIAILLRDLEPDIVPRLGAKLLPKEFWDDILAARDRGVSPRKIFANLDGKIDPFYKGSKQFENALNQERARRRKAAAAKPASKGGAK